MSGLHIGKTQTYTAGRLLRPADACPQIGKGGNKGAYLRRATTGKWSQKKVYAALVEENNGRARVDLVTVEGSADSFNLAPFDDNVEPSLQRPDYLPRRRDIIDAFDNAPGRWLAWIFNPHFLQFEILTDVFIAALAEYLEERIICYHKICGKEVVIVEDGAGNGRLAYFLDMALKGQNLPPYRIAPIDSGAWDIVQFFPVEKMDYAEALQKYRPQIVVCSWMPQGKDHTRDYREKEDCREYILIGKPPVCGDMWASWGMRDIGEKGGNEPPYHADGFSSHALEEVHQFQLCRSDFLGQRSLSRLRNPRSFSCSEIFSFRRK